MTLDSWDVALYAGALLALFLTPGPVWFALMARTVAGGFHAGWPLAFGVAVGDAAWPLVALLGLGWIVAVYGQIMDALRWVGCVVFVVFGIVVIRNAKAEITESSRLTRPGMWAGFVAGVAAILGNPKAILFYMGVLPGFFDLNQVTRVDLAVIVGLSAAVPLVGNLCVAVFISRIRNSLMKGTVLPWVNRIAGGLLVGVGLLLLFT